MRLNEEKYFAYGTALINALVLSKVILIGEYMGLGKRHEARPLVFSTIYKSFVFTLLTAAFHIAEHAIRGLVQGEPAGALSGTAISELFGRCLVLFFAFLPFFALRETGRVLGETRLKDLFFKPRVQTEYDQPAPVR